MEVREQELASQSENYGNYYERSESQDQKRRDESIVVNSILSHGSIGGVSVH